jgi:hypothetical protein
MHVPTAANQMKLRPLGAQPTRTQSDARKEFSSVVCRRRAPQKKALLASWLEREGEEEDL